MKIIIIPKQNINITIHSQHTVYNNILFIQILTNIIQKDTSTLSDLYYAVSGLASLSQKIPSGRIDKLVKLIQATLRKDDSLWK